MASSTLPTHRHEQFINAYIRQIGSDRSIARQLKTTPETISHFFNHLDRRLHAVGWIPSYIKDAEQLDEEEYMLSRTKPAHNLASNTLRLHRGLGGPRKENLYIRAKAITGYVAVGAMILKQKAPHLDLDELMEPFFIGFMEDMKMIVQVAGPLNRTPSQALIDQATAKLKKNFERRMALTKMYVLKMNRAE